MKVITHGKFGARRHRCVGCECVFEYKTEEEKVAWTVEYEDGHKEGYSFVTCPDCCMKIDVDKVYGCYFKEE